jgi:spoIIIJ-associated protein
MSDPADPTHDAQDHANQTEATGETVGEAKWAAVRELERRFPGLDKASVEFVVLSEGERGLLGVGFVPARVIARVSDTPARADVAPAAPLPTSPASSPAERLGELLEYVRHALALDATVGVRESPEGLTATFQGRDLGLVIGKHGQTIDAIQYLASAAVSRVSETRLEVVVDAAGYRERRRASVELLADRAAASAAAMGESVALDPMSSAERKIVHVRLKERADVVTTSEGADPNRRVVVSPA